MLGITGLQLYWNYQNYKSVVANFKKDANNAIGIAVERELNLRHEKIALIAKKWMLDTSFITITCNTNNKDSNTVFTMQDAHPYYNSKPISIGISTYKQKIKKITPEVKKLFVNHFINNILKGDLKKGVIYFYTPRLGDSLSKIHEQSKADVKTLAIILKKELATRDIYSAFTLGSKNKISNNQFKTNTVNTALRRPYEKEYITASLENPNQHYLREMKWLIIGSFLLIGITIICFYYTVKTLINQHKLVAIKNQFISNMTHEINTPLASIQVTAEALQKFKPDEETAIKYLDIILYQTQKLNELSNEILENAKLETLNFTMDEQVDLKRLINDVLADLNTGLSVSIDYEEGDFTISGNNAHLHRSITNLIENAIKYNTSSIPAISINLSKTGGNICISVQDNGPGIADEFKSKIFDQFYRIPTGNMHDVKGYGLGLSYVKKVISQHRGSISVTDNSPVGTVFSIILPA